MVERLQAADSKPSDDSAVTPSPAPKRPPGHRSSDVRDTVAEMAARAQEISQEAGSKVAQAMKDVINAAAGLAGFAMESARDLVQYMVRRGQMTQEEADKLLREAEEAYSKRKPAATTIEERPAAPPEAKKPAPPAKPIAAKKPAAAKTARTPSTSTASKGKAAGPSSRAKAAAKSAGTKSARPKKKR